MERNKEAVHKTGVCEAKHTHITPLVFKNKPGVVSGDCRVVYFNIFDCVLDLFWMMNTQQQVTKNLPLDGRHLKSYCTRDSVVNLTFGLSVSP